MIDRRATIVGGAAVVALAGGLNQARAQQPGTSLQPAQKEGVETKILNEGSSIIPGYKRVRLLDVVVQPGKSFGPNKMETPMVCHMLDGEMEITQDMGGGTFTAKKNHVWTCNTGMTEAGTNKGTSPATMRITFLLPS
ncbi:MAG: hypothetical protein QOG66_849 [Methylobacteriaceae bacterium]|nr:hypothetical protein [Methylobacteriaceae bacterium]